MILITGATGTIGSEVVRLLLERGEPVRSLTRDPARAAGGEVVRADFDDPESLRAAFDGVSTAFLATAFGPRLKEHDLAMVEAARLAGVKKVVKLSAIGTGDTEDPADIRAWHLAGERAIQESGMAWTMLRPAGFASNALAWAEAVRSGGQVPNFTGDGAQGVVDPRDVAAVAAEILTGALTGTAHESRAYALTGPELLSVPGQVAVVARTVGRPVETLAVSIEDAAAGMRRSGAGEDLVAAVVAGWTMLRDEGYPVLTDTVQAVLGRPATSFESWVQDHRAAFTE
ncbi:NAD(P)H-binding protein [Nonomuraea sp. NPDC005983]|uniref:NAD(P)H-binding protein n=1 Tax=Nonomuraea sp. NPDC005983 TaxID=3155595 RepID=UPI0033A15AA9